MTAQKKGARRSHPTLDADGIHSANYSDEMSSESPSSHRATLISSTFWLETPPSGEISTRSRLEAAIFQPLQDLCFKKRMVDRIGSPAILITLRQRARKEDTAL